ncbi:hypothetical protein V6N13_089850 [Hibiscus sabdariffa]|uniref:RRM domain-containing protein n=1 Tax=Hibiscus sabdariffa TaxID=183260 RepID=A0ABR2QJ58_9ROSI
MQSTSGADLNPKQEQEQQQQQPQQRPQQWVAGQWMGAMQYPTAAAMYQQYQQQQQQQQQGKHPYQQQSYSQKQQQQGSNSDEVKTIWVGDLTHWMDETYLHGCFSQTGEVSSVKIIRNKQTGQSEGYGFVEFYSRTAAEKGIWLQMFGDENERSRAMTEMNGVYCSSRPMRIGVATPKKVSGYQQQYSSQAVVLSGGHASNGAVGQGSQYDNESNNATIFVGGLDSDVTDDDLRQPFSQFGEVISVKIPTGKGCGFVQFVNRKDAEEAIQSLNGTTIGNQTVRLSWGRNVGSKQWRGDSVNQRNGGYYQGQGYGGYGYGYGMASNQDPSTYAAAAIPGAS